MAYFNYREGLEAAPGYRLVHMLGRGGFGQVWKATGPGNVDVALKIIQDFSRKKGVKELRSLQMLKGIRHPNIVPVFSIWLKAEDGSFLSDASEFTPEDQHEDLRQTRLAYQPTPHDLPSELLIAMGLADMSLSDRLSQCLRAGQPGIPLDELLTYIEDAAKALDFLSRRHNIQHCDIKPQNILVLGDAAQVCDFGLAKALSDMRNTSLGAMTVAYAAPEVFMRRGPTSFSDQYSLAISYYELRTGHLPFHETNVREVLEQKERGDLDMPLVSDAEREVLTRAVNPEPERRYPDVVTMVKQLRAAASGSPPVAEAAKQAPMNPPVIAEGSSSRVHESPPAHGLTQAHHRVTLPDPHSKTPAETPAREKRREEPPSAPPSSAKPPTKHKSTTAPASVGPDRSAPPQEENGMNSVLPATAWLPDEAALGYQRQKPFDRQGEEQIWIARGPSGGQALLFERPLRPLALAGLARFPQLLSLKHPNLHDATAVWIVSDSHGVLSGDELARASSSALHSLTEAASPRLVWCGEFVPESLHHKMRVYRRERGAGIPAIILLDYMEQLAAAVDFLNEPRHALQDKKVGVQHGALRPCHYLVRGSQVFLANLGQALLLEGSYGRPAQDVILGQEKWVAPEMRGGALSRWSDQFSLAVSYVEMRSGISAAHGELKSKGLNRQECEVLRRAGLNDPAGRYNSCRELVEALREANRADKTTASRAKSAPKALAPTSIQAERLSDAPLPAPSPPITSAAVAAPAASAVEENTLPPPMVADATSPVSMAPEEPSPSTSVAIADRDDDGGGAIDMSSELAPQTKTMGGLDTVPDDSPAREPEEQPLEISRTTDWRMEGDEPHVEAGLPDLPQKQATVHVAVPQPEAQKRPTEFGCSLRIAVGAVGLLIAIIVGAAIWDGDEPREVKDPDRVVDQTKKGKNGDGAASAPSLQQQFAKKLEEARRLWSDDDFDGSRRAASEAEALWRKWRPESQSSEPAAHAAGGGDVLLLLARGLAKTESPDWVAVATRLDERATLAAEEAPSQAVLHSLLSLLAQGAAAPAPRLIEHKQLALNAPAEEKFWAPDEDELKSLKQLFAQARDGEVAALRGELFVESDPSSDFERLDDRLDTITALGGGSPLADVARAERDLEAKSGDVRATPESIQARLDAAKQLDAGDRSYGHYVESLALLKRARPLEAADAVVLAVASKSDPWMKTGHRQRKAKEILTRAAADFSLEKLKRLDWTKRLQSPFGNPESAGRLGRWLDAAAALDPSAEANKSLRALAGWRSDPRQMELASSLARQADSPWSAEAWRAEHAPVLAMFAEVGDENAALAPLSIRARLRLAELARDGGEGAPGVVDIYKELLEPAASLGDRSVAARPDEKAKAAAAAAHAAIGALLRNNRYEEWELPDVGRATLAAFDKAVKLDDSVADYFAGRAWARLNQKGADLGLAESDAQTAIRLDAKRADGHAVAGSVYILRSRAAGDLQDRLSHLHNAVKECDIAVKECESGSTLQAFALINRSNAHLEIGNYACIPLEEKRSHFEKARDDALAASRIDWSFNDSAFHALGNALEDLAWIAHEKPDDNYQSAVQAFTEAIHRQGDELCFMSRGRCRYKYALDPNRGADTSKSVLLQEAEADLREAIKAGSSAAEGHLWLARVLEANGDLAGAVKAYEAGLIAAPQRHDFAGEKARVHELLRQPQEMHAAFETAVKTAKEGGPARRKYLYEWAVEARPEKKPSPSAQAIIARAAAGLTADESPEARFFAGIAAELAGDRAKAIDHYTRGINGLPAMIETAQKSCLDISDRAAALYYQRGVVRYRHSPSLAADARPKAQKEAIEDLRLAAEAVNKTHPSQGAAALAKSAEFHTQIGQQAGVSSESVRKGLDLYRQALVLAPNHPQAWSWRFNLVTESFQLAGRRFPDKKSRDEALKHLREALASAPDEFKAQIGALKDRVQAAP